MIRIALLISLLGMAVLRPAYADSLSYSGRLVNANGSPVTGPVNLKAELAYTNAPTVILCSDEIAAVPLVNGVFHLKLELDCSPSSLKTILANTPANEAAAIRITDQSNSKVYSFQALHSIPTSIISQMSKQLVQMSATNGQVLTWNGTQWSPADPVGTVGGVVTIVGSEGVSAVRVDETVTVGLVDGGVTAAKLDSMGAANGQVLKWNGSAWAPAADSDTGVATEADPHVRAFARSDVTGIVPEICNSNQVLHYVSVDNSLRCFDLVDDAIVDGESNKAPSQNAVFDALALKQNTIDTNSELMMKSVRVTNDGTTWMGLKAPNAAGNIYFTLPAGAGVDGQVLKTDGAGNLAWVTPSSNSASIVDGSIVDADIAPGANINQAKIAGLDTALTNLNNRITNLTTTDIAEGTNLYFTEPRVLGTDLAGLNTTNGTINSSDTVLSSIGKLIGNLAVVSTAQSNYVLKSGDTMSGHLQMGGFTVTGLGVPSGDTDAATKKYVDDVAAAGSSKWTKTVDDIHFTTGNVGIGTSAPTTKLHISGDNGSDHLVQIESPNDSAAAVFVTAQPSGDYAGFGVRRVSSGGDGWNIGMGPSDNNFVVTSRVAGTNTDRVVVTPSGNVGIGTTSPGLISGSSKYLTIGQTGVSADKTSVEIYSSGNYSNLTDAGKLDFIFRSTIPSDVNVARVAAQAGTNTTRGHLGFYTRGLSGLLSQRMVIHEDGNVGIGTTSPNEKLTVEGRLSLKEGSAPTATANYGKLYVKTDSKLYFMNDSGAETVLGSSDGGTPGDNTVTSAKITDGEIVNADISPTAAIAATKIGTGTVDNTELSYLDGATSNIQTQINNLRTVPAGSDTSKYLRGDNSWQTLDTSVVPEAVANQYFTQQRVLDSLLSGYAGTAASALPIGDGESVITSLKKLQMQITANDTAFDATGQWSKNDPNIYYNSGNVGIGTTNPESALAIGTLGMTGGLYGIQIGKAGASSGMRFGENNENYGQFMWHDLLNHIEFTTRSSGTIYTNNLVLKDGKVGIGTYAPAEKLSIQDGSILLDQTSVASIPTLMFKGLAGAGVPVIKFFNPDNTTNKYIWYGPRDGSLFTIEGSATDGTTGDQYLRLTDAGNLGIGTAPNSRLHILQSADSSAGGIRVTNTTNTATASFFVDANDHTHIGGATASPDAIIIKNTSGDVGIGVLAPSERLEVGGNVKATAYLYTSDRRLKKNIQTLKNSEKKVLQLRGVEFDWKNNGEHELGFIAQEVEAVEPSLVVTSEVDGIKAVKYGNVVALLVEAFKAHHQKIEENQKMFMVMNQGMNTRVKELEREVASLKEENERLKEDIELIKKHLKMKR